MSVKVVATDEVFEIGENAYGKYRQSPEGVKDGLWHVARSLNDEGWYVKEGYVLEAISLIDNLLKSIEELEEKVSS